MSKNRCKTHNIRVVSYYWTVNKNTHIKHRCNLLGRITRSQTKQTTNSTDAQLKDEHDELTTIA